MGRVNDLILSRTISDVSMIPELAEHLISSGGKRLRPMLTCAAARLFDYPANAADAHVRLAAAVEFMHTATLLHDDVVDESDQRRGKPTARMIWGNQASVLVGDFLLGQAFQMMVETGSMEALGVLSVTSAIIAEGEVMQLVAAKNLATSEDQYLKVINAKTAQLFSAAAEVGGIVAGADADQRKSLEAYGRDLGIAFQLVDDALDYSGEQAALGKNTGDDLREGKVTLPVILAHMAGNTEERAFWQRTIVQGDVTDADITHASGLMTRHGALDETFRRAEACADRAISHLSELPSGAVADALAEAARFSVRRIS
ncbi:MAG: polyprenyl synthetase family protein [Pseudomonadota bacterium]